MRMYVCLYVGLGPLAALLHAVLLLLVLLDHHLAHVALLLAGGDLVRWGDVLTLAKPVVRHLSSDDGGRQKLPGTGLVYI